MSPVKWPIEEGCVGTDILHTETFKRGLGKFHFFRFQESREIVQHHGDFPFILTTGRVLEHYNCGTMTRRTGNARIVTEDVPPSTPTTPRRKRMGVPADDLDVVLQRQRWRCARVSNQRC